MTKSDWLTAPALALAAVLMLPLMAAASPDLVDVCHLTSDSAPDGHEWRHIRVNPKSLGGHLSHGDLRPGDEVPGTDGPLKFDEDCSPQQADPADLPEEPSDIPEDPPEPPQPPPTELVFAVAYSDVDPDDGGYNSEVDVLIAKLVDGPEEGNDGVPGAGDLIVTHMYPEDVDATGLGAFTVLEHNVTAFGFGTGYSCLVQTEAGSFSWSSGQGNFDQYSEWSSVASFTNIYDDRTTDSVEEDLIQITSSSPSLPSGDLTVNGSDTSDQVFVDVEANCLAGAS
jgi:hypothetical protein